MLTLVPVLTFAVTWWLGIVIAGTLSLTTLGVVTALALAAITTVFAELQITGLRRA